ncbi:MAG: polyprenol monophosphomannose synthase [Nitrospira sp.]|nr:polyprenol monophosphomannose synthase [Nitrospira sp.]
MRYRRITSVEELSHLSESKPDELFLVPTFEVAEALITKGIDSALVAIDWPSVSEKSDLLPPPPSSIGSLFPRCAFQFDQPILVVLPTYNERQNLEIVTNAIRKYLMTDILIVDDNSPDGTGILADELSRRHPFIHVLHRPQKDGLGSAYLAGFQWALARDYYLIIEMDCDLSHAPWDLPRLVYHSTSADLVIGSRYIPGGSVEGWDVRRRLISQLANCYVRLFLGSKIRDWTGGFRCFRRTLLTQLDLQGVYAKGYVFQVEMAWRALRRNARVREIPIRFRNRAHGRSKLGWPVIYEAIKTVPLMAMGRMASE